ncbi:helicase-related protein [Aneurinibacillus sp. Ricciae_BoGa-3]|uniref:DEAD/DEAH box helicase n=1 Tax=Aneurinibacillus sp. Ricciae_BoGa-3 TaxID=3022697 RepID=UPI002340A601|nr:helicase-related protein [Aneurinibacillus sp. Ricciae_BoGa-3]WCK54206.1 helicase-related protein [Aneurinibacillus sp. Ricciae_BoGa-3]
MKGTERFTRIYETIKGRALLEDELWWLLESTAKAPHLLQREKIMGMVEQLILDKKIVRKQGVERVCQHITDGERSKLSFLFSLLGGHQKQASVYQCSRCGAADSDIAEVFCHRCGGLCRYCRRCLSMGRSTSCTSFYLIPYEGPSDCIEIERTDAGEDIVPDPFDSLNQFANLTTAQLNAARQALAFLYRREHIQADEFLIWAVCGAGKTEVMFPILHAALRQGQRVLWATPRRDVVLELAPRLAAAFPEVPIGVLHGKSPEKWSPAALILATTHQALRFFRSFDVVIVDEVDAYPYTADDLLPFAVKRARKLPGKTIYLTATPRREHQQRMRVKEESSKRLPHVKIPVRYHGHPLPVPVIRLESKLNKCLKNGIPSLAMRRFLDKLKTEGAPGFIFVPAVHELDLLKRYILNIDSYWADHIETAHASDPGREEKVMAMRRGERQLLLTTTIMERGVTLPNISVLVCRADAAVFDEAALVQIAGRAGRSKDYPKGDVIFLAAERSVAMKAAIRQITDMNRLAAREGYFQSQADEQRG